MAIVPEVPFTASDWQEMMATFQPGSGDTISSRRSAASLVGYIDATKTRAFIRYAIGYSYADVVSPFQLHRINPARHPDMPWLFVDSITFNDQGPIGNSANIDNAANLPAVGNTSGPGYKFTKYGRYLKAQCTVSFIQFPYNFISDDNADFNDFGRPEYLRNCERFRSTDPQLDVLQAETDRFLVFTEGTYTRPTPPGGTESLVGKSFPGSIGEYVMKTGFLLKWYQVPEDYVMENGKPTKILNCMGKVNLNAFLGFSQGTLLCQAPKFTRYQQPIQTTDEQGIYAYDIEIPFQYFNPEPGAGLGSTYKGHNLFPFARAGGPNGPAWFSVNRGGIANQPYIPFVDFATMFQSVLAP